jgi:hypothetical protein
MKTHIEVTISREELYRRIWERPMRDVAAELGISDVGLKKTCRRAGIPTPPQGYHLMSEEETKKRLRIPLPKAISRQSADLVFRVPDKEVASAEKQAVLRVREVSTREPYPLTAEQSDGIDSALKELRGRVNIRQTDRRGMIVVPKEGYPNSHGVRPCLLPSSPLLILVLVPIEAKYSHFAFLCVLSCPSFANFASTNLRLGS